MAAEAHQVLALCGIVRVVPVADVDEVDRVVLDEAVQASFVERVRSLLTA